MKAVSGSPSVVRCSLWPELLSKRTANEGQRTVSMFAKRIIPCLDCKTDRRQGVRFVNLRDRRRRASSPKCKPRGRRRARDARYFGLARGPRHAHGTVNRVARKLFIRSLSGVVCEPSKTLGACSRMALTRSPSTPPPSKTPDLIRELAARYGRRRRRRHRRAAGSNSNSTIENVTQRASSFEFRSLELRPAFRSPGFAPGWLVVTYGGTRPTGLDAVEWARRVESRGRRNPC